MLGCDRDDAPVPVAVTLICDSDNCDDADDDDDDDEEEVGVDESGDEADEESCEWVVVVAGLAFVVCAAVAVVEVVEASVLSSGVDVVEEARRPIGCGGGDDDDDGWPACGGGGLMRAKICDSQRTKRY